MAGPLTVDDALARVAAAVSPLAAEDVPLEQAVGRHAAEDVAAASALPRFPSSAMDGFAVRAADVPGVLVVTERSAAGAPATGAVLPGCAIAVTTGGVVPAGADAVVPLELTADEGARVVVHEPVAVGAHIRPVGRDVAAGAVVVPAGRRLGAAQLAGLAATGVASVRCRRRPRVAVVTTGTELQALGKPLGPGQIYESNGLMLAAVFAASGAVVERHDRVGDDPASHRQALASALEADVVVTSGGVSVGPLDLVRATLAGLGAEEQFWGVAMRPGKPLVFARRGATLVFGLPGNPVSALVGAHLFVAPVLRGLQGGRCAPAFVPVLAGEAHERHPQREDFPRITLERSSAALPTAYAVAGQESHMIASSALAEGVIRIAGGQGQVPAGTVLQALLFD